MFALDFSKFSIEDKFRLSGVLIMVIFAFPVIIRGLIASFMNKAAKKLASKLPSARAPWFSLGSRVIIGEFLGLKYRIDFVSSSYGSDTLWIHLYKEFLFKLNIYKKPVDLSLVRIVGKEFKTNDLSFDEQCLLATNNLVLSKNYLDNNKIKSVITELINHGFDSVGIGSKGIIVGKGGYQHDDVDPERILTIIKQLFILTKV